MARPVLALPLQQRRQAAHERSPRPSGIGRLIAEAGGNPLPLRELPGALTSEQLAGRAA